MNIGILALQGDYTSHAKVLQKLEVPFELIRNPEQLENIQGLIIPGGESTVMLKFLWEEHFISPLKEFHAKGKGILGTCAGAILLAKDVIPSQQSLGFIDVGVERNAYGRQLSSKIVLGEYQQTPLEVVLIRAPRIIRVGKNVEILGRLKNTEEIICVRENNIMITTFHSELTNDLRVHKDFLQTIRSKQCETTK